MAETSLCNCFRSRLMHTKFFSFLFAVYFYHLLMRHHWFDHWCSGNIIWGICNCILNHSKVFYWVLTRISSGKMASKLHSWKDRICIIWTQHCFFFFARKHLFFKKNNVISKGFLPNFIIIHWKFYSIISKKRKTRIYRVSSQENIDGTLYMASKSKLIASLPT